MIGLNQFAYYRELKKLKSLIRIKVIKNMPKAHKYPDALYLKEHLGMIVRLTAAVAVTDKDDYQAKEEYLKQILFELYLIIDEIEEQEEAHIISRDTAADIYIRIKEIEGQLTKFRLFFTKKRDSDCSRASDGV